MLCPILLRGTKHNTQCTTHNTAHRRNDYRCKMSIAQCTSHNAQRTRIMQSAQCKMHFALCTMQSAQCKVHNAPTPISTQHTTMCGLLKFATGVNNVCTAKVCYRGTRYG